MSSPGTKPLSSLDRPILIAVCKTNQFDYSLARTLGYPNSTNYLTGKTNNTSVLSWTGFKGNRTFQDTFDHLHRSGLDDIEFDVTDGNISKRFLIPHGLCKVYEGKAPKIYLQINLRSVKDLFIYHFYVSDPAMVNSFQLPYSLLTGEKIWFETMPNSTLKKYVEYNIQLKETTVRTKDGSCSNYPYHNHASYYNCVGDEMRENILPVLGCMVPWISKKGRSICFICP